jgi:hypothetical protein
LPFFFIVPHLLLEQHYRIPKTMASRKRLRADTAGSSTPQPNTLGHNSSNAAQNTGPSAIHKLPASNSTQTIPEYDLQTALKALPAEQLVNTLIALSPSNANIIR